jgi:ABC-type transporter MlaC component
MKKLVTLTTMTFLLSAVFAFAQAPANPDQPATAPAKTATKSTKKTTKGHKKTAVKKTTATAPAAQK